MGRNAPSVSAASFQICPRPSQLCIHTLEVNMAAHRMLSRVLVSSGKFLSLRTVSSSFRPEGMFNSYFSSLSQCKEFLEILNRICICFCYSNLPETVTNWTCIDFYCKWVVIIRAYLWKLTASILTKEAGILMRGLYLYFYFDFVRPSYQICPNCPVKYY